MLNVREVNFLQAFVGRDTIYMNDVHSVPCEIARERINMENLPKASYIEAEKRWKLTIPARYSKSGKRCPIYAKTELALYKKYLGLITNTFETEKVETQLVSNIPLQVKSYPDTPQESKKNINLIPSLSDFTIEVLKTYKLGIKAEATYDSYETKWRMWIKDTVIGKKPIDEVTSADLTRLFKLLTNGRYTEGYVKIMKTVLNSTFKRAKERKFVDDNPLDYVEISYKKCKKIDSNAKEIFTIDEILLMGKVIDEAFIPNKSNRYFWSPIFMVMGWTGMRIGEAFALKWSDIDFHNHTITINKQAAEAYKRDENGERIGKMRYEKDPKTFTSTREIIMLDIVEEWLLKLKYRYESMGINSEKVVVNKKLNTPLKSNACDMLKRILRDAGIEYASSHKFRRFFATESIDNDVELSWVAALLGHKNVRVTLDSYYKRSDKKDKDSIRSKLNVIYNRESRSFTGSTEDHINCKKVG